MSHTIRAAIDLTIHAMLIELHKKIKKFQNSSFNFNFKIQKIFENN